jgi:hypothetical protein
MKKIQNIFTAKGETKQSGLGLLRNFSQPITFVSGVLLLLVVLCATFAPLIAFATVTESIFHYLKFLWLFA